MQFCIFVLCVCVDFVFDCGGFKFGKFFCFIERCGRFPGAIFSEKSGVMGLFDLQLFREPESVENIEICLVTCAHVVRSILLQRRRLAARRTIKVGCRDYVLEIRFVE